MSIPPATGNTPIESTRIGPEDPRYRAVVDKRFNKRYSAKPDYVRLVGSGPEVVSAVPAPGRSLRHGEEPTPGLEPGTPSLPWKCSTD